MYVDNNLVSDGGFDGGAGPLSIDTFKNQPTFPEPFGSQNHLLTNDRTTKPIWSRIDPRDVPIVYDSFGNAVTDESCKETNRRPHCDRYTDRVMTKL